MHILSAGRFHPAVFLSAGQSASGKCDTTIQEERMDLRSSNSLLNRTSLWAALLVIIAAVFPVLGFAAADDEIKVGVVLPITGREGKPGQYQKEGIELAIKKINDAGGVYVK